MSNLKAKVSLFVVMLLIVSAFSVAFAGDYIMNLSVSYNGETLQDRESIELYNSDKNRTLTITTDAKYVDDSLTIYWSRSGGPVFEKLSTGKKSATFTIPADLTEGNATQFVFEAVSNDFGNNFVGNSNAVRVWVNCPKEEDVNVTANLEYNGKTIEHLDTIRCAEGDTLRIVGNSNIGVKLVAYKWDNGSIVEIDGSSANIKVPALGEGKKLSIVAQAKDGKWSNSKTFTVLPKAEEDETTIEAYLRKDGVVVENRATIEVGEGTKLVVSGTSNKGVKLVSYKWGNGNVVEINGSSATIPVPADLGDGLTLGITAQATDGKWANSKTFTVKAGSSVEPIEPEDDDDDELIIEPWMKENDDLNKLAVSLRSEPYENEDRANKNIYALNEKVVYYVDYKNGGKKTDKEVKLVLDLPLAATVVNSDGGSVSKKDGTITWTFKNGLDKEESGTKTVVVKYTSLGSSKATFKRITPKATIFQDGKKKDLSAVINLIVKDFDVEIKDEHDPYMYGDLGTGTFRPDDTITRAEGALVLTRIFGISTSNDNNTYDFPDLNETYVSARRAIRAARAYGLIEGFPDGNYYPNKTMTRAEFMTIIARQLEEEEGDGFEVKEADDLIKIYKDKTKVYYLDNNETYDAHWAAGYATLLCRLNMAPVSEKNTNLRLDQPISRAEVAQLVNFYLLRAPAEVTKSTKIGFPDVNRNHKLIGDIVEATRASHTWSLNEDGEEVEED
ncbi:MAG: S-layer homology domain-containing protein [Clostridia bacterium]|nr:S-layer homology domain-containing protein [Clostridia bacterium]